MLNRFQGWRERGWSVVDASTYSDAWQRYGGSVATHPQVVERLAGQTASTKTVGATRCRCSRYE